MLCRSTSVLFLFLLVFVHVTGEYFTYDTRPDYNYTANGRNPSTTVGNYDEGYWTYNLPFNVTYDGAKYSAICINSNGYLSFGNCVASYGNLITLQSPHILIDSGDNIANNYTFR